MIDVESLTDEELFQLHRAVGAVVRQRNHEWEIGAVQREAARLATWVSFRDPILTHEFYSTLDESAQSGLMLMCVEHQKTEGTTVEETLAWLASLGPYSHRKLDSREGEARRNSYE